ncbi:MAG: IPT/TIG domain-containing protein, partial [Gemmatimonadales bacterium]|nr:IPT/TIG domain-containing protein [Gemmatimonadales bacterium]
MVVTAADGRPVTGAAVRWTVINDAGATVLDDVTLSDGSGRAEVAVKLGSVSGSFGVRATLEAVPTKIATFSFQVLPAPTLTGVTPATFSGGDQVVLEGTRLSDTLQVDIGGSRATVLSGSVTGFRITVRVPPCLVPGTVDIKLIFAYGESAPITGTYQETTGSLALDPGDHVSLDPSVVAGCASFPAAGPAGAQYVVVPQATAGIPGVSVDYRLGGDPVMPASPSAAPAFAEPTSAERFHDFLRRREAEFAQIPKELVQPPSLVEAAAASIKVGDVRDFRVCSIVTCSDPQDFAEVTAVARYVGQHAALYVDRAAPDTMSSADLQSIGQLFDEEIYDVVSHSFGAESDVDANGHVLILMTPVVNGLTPTSDCETSIVTGFFFAIDVDPAFKNDSRSNQGEVFYALTPDPALV